VINKWATISSFAKDMANDIAKRYPPKLDKEVGKRPSVNRLTRIMEDSCQKALQFHAENRLGWISKAKLGNDFRWELRGLGYQNDFVEFATEAVIVSLSKKKS
jgi:hypothetical protein